MYIREALRQLDDKSYYEPLPKLMQPDTQVIVREFVDRLFQAGFTNKKQKLYLYGPDDARPRQFYLPITIILLLTITHVLPKGRPIVSDCGSESYRIAEFIDFYLNPLSQKHPSYIKDSYHFVEVLRRQEVPVETLLFTIDVESPYTNIDTHRGFRVVRNLFNKYPDPSRQDEFILELLTS